MLEGVKRQAVKVSAATGLKEETCFDLLISGWSFHTEINKPDSWLSPSASIRLPGK